MIRSTHRLECWDMDADEDMDVTWACGKREGPGWKWNYFNHTPFLIDESDVDGLALVISNCPSYSSSTRKCFSTITCICKLCVGLANCSTWEHHIRNSCVMRLNECMLYKRVHLAICIRTSRSVHKVVQEYFKALKPWSNYEYLQKMELLDDHHSKIQTRAKNRALTLVFWIQFQWFFKFYIFYLFTKNIYISMYSCSKSHCFYYDFLQICLNVFLSGKFRQVCWPK